MIRNRFIIVTLVMVLKGKTLINAIICHLKVIETALNLMEVSTS